MSRIWRGLTWPFRKRRWLWWLVPLLVLPPIWILLFDPDRIPVELPPAPEGKTWRIAVADWGHHASIILEVPGDWRLGPPGEERARFLDYGWGDRRFFMESRSAPHVLFHAVLLPSASIVYIRSRGAIPEDDPDRWRIMVKEIDGETLRRVVTLLEEAMVRNPDGTRPEALPPVEGFRGRFYPGRESYIFWRSCNAWIARVLAEAGFDVNPIGVVTPGQVHRRLQGFRPHR